MKYPKPLHEEQKRFLLYCRSLDGFTQIEYNIINAVLLVNSYHERHVKFLNQLRTDKFTKYSAEIGTIDLKNINVLKKLNKRRKI